MTLRSTQITYRRHLRLVGATIVIAGHQIVTTAPALADDLFEPPEGCSATLTVQSLSCEVTHIYSCAADGAGINRSVVYGNDGPLFLDKIDFETQWLETFIFFDNSLETLITPATDPANLTQLLETGIDTYDFRLNTPEGEMRVVGYDQIAGPEFEIDGEPLFPMVFEGRYERNGIVTMTMSGKQYVSAGHRRFFAGEYNVTENGETRSWDASPVEFIYPGDPGFLSTQPRYECQATTIGLTPDYEGDLE